MEEHYAIDDSILPILDLPVPSMIRVDIYPDCIRLTVGPRDYEWPRGCPDTCATGTHFEPPIPIDGPPEEA